MKFVLFVLILCFSLHFNSALFWFNTEVKKVTKPVNTQRTTALRQQFISRLQKSARNMTVSQQQKVITSNANRVNQSPLQRALLPRTPYIRYTSGVQRQADSVKKQSNQTIPRDRFRGVVYQQRNGTVQRPAMIRQTNRTVINTNNRVLNSKLQPISRNNTNINNLAARRRTLSQVKVTKALLADSKQTKTSIVRNNQIHSLQHGTPVAKNDIKNTRTSLLHRTLTKKVANNITAQNQRRLQDNSLYQQRLKAFRNGTHPHSNLQSTLRRQKRQNELNDVPLERFNSMVFVRDAPAKEEDFDSS
ncbi:hypothetical protein I4U23_030873 [Adineta vaga]|nr:hypothetical protein I4U23_030873 [Adineta vaga]